MIVSTLQTIPSETFIHKHLVDKVAFGLGHDLSDLPRRWPIAHLLDCLVHPTQEEVFVSGRRPAVQTASEAASLLHAVGIDRAKALAGVLLAFFDVLVLADFLVVVLSSDLIDSQREQFSTRIGDAVEAAAVAAHILHIFRICHAEAPFGLVLAIITCIHAGILIML